MLLFLFDGLTEQLFGALTAFHLALEAFAPQVVALSAGGWKKANQTKRYRLPSNDLFMPYQYLLYQDEKMPRTDETFCSR